MRGVILGLGVVVDGAQSAWGLRDGTESGCRYPVVTKGRKLSRFLEVGQDGVMGQSQGAHSLKLPWPAWPKVELLSF